MQTAFSMSKVFLHHLNPLIGLAGFNELWHQILDYFERFMNIGSDMLYEAVSRTKSLSRLFFEKDQCAVEKIDYWSFSNKTPDFYCVYA